MSQHSFPTGNGAFLINKQGYSPVMVNSYDAMLAESPPRGSGRSRKIKYGKRSGPIVF